MSSDPAPLDLALAEAPAGGRAVWLRAGAVRLRAALWEGGARGQVLIFPGRSEYIEKYGRVVAELTGRGFAVAALDWRGQGLSDRLLDDPMKGHVEDFEDYQRDVEAFLAAPGVAGRPGPRIALCHSMGGCIALRALGEGRLSADAAILSSPMLGLNMPPALQRLSRAVTATAERLDMGRVYAPLPLPQVTSVLRTWFNVNKLTGDRENYDFMRRQARADPRLVIGGPTLNWVARAEEAAASVLASPPPALPMLTFLGEEESTVSPEAIRDFAARAAACELVELPRSRHEPLFETPEIRALLWARIDAFLAARGLGADG